ncbi:hypothetical protein ABR776_27185 [Bacillus cereus]|uniref:Uncharacterized protein n=1 Tax=Bacillus cereus TaxID=1396 RepID=A0A1C4DT69_BACCE|nr:MULTISPECIES: hypothetical protein [Bacillus cereus group]HDR7784930.1 hypothetical protein [Bacillus wiedmannii]MCU5435807.1 hypothetical protein [Bacillus mobilis]OKA27352.1 hypothetical protein BJR06_30030 [Bacillus cereus]OKA30496.1 hypothetical protein BJR07_29965 [Bacillus cereus]SCC34594.1 Uncharacterized protein BC0861_03609 [Bacillus mobilis]
MKMTVVTINMTEIIAPFIKKGEWVAFEGKDYTMYAEVEDIAFVNTSGCIAVYGAWGNESVMNVGDKGWQFAEQCRKATEDEQYWEERRRVFAARGRKNNEFHPGDFASNDKAVLTVQHQDHETGIVTVLVNNSDESFQVDPKELEIYFFAEDMAG